MDKESLLNIYLVLEKVGTQHNIFVKYEFLHLCKKTSLSVLLMWQNNWGNKFIAFETLVQSLWLARASLIDGDSPLVKAVTSAFIIAQ